MNDDVLREARDRLDWLREEYGEGDIDYVTFAPVVDMAGALLTTTRRLVEERDNWLAQALPTKPTDVRVKRKYLQGLLSRRPLNHADSTSEAQSREESD